MAVVLKSRRQRLEGRLPAVRVSTRLEADVATLAKQSGVSRADVVREAVEFFFAQSDPNCANNCANTDGESQS